MKRTIQMTVLAMSLALESSNAQVIVENTAAHPVPVSLPTHLGVQPIALVNLVCTGGTGGCATNFLFEGQSDQASGPSTTNITRYPPGFDFLVTDISWFSANNTGSGLFSLFGSVPPPAGNLVFLSTAVADSLGFAGANVHFTSGILLQHLPVFVVSTRQLTVSFQGYFVPHQL